MNGFLHGAKMTLLVICLPIVIVVDVLLLVVLICSIFTGNGGDLVFFGLTEKVWSALSGHENESPAPQQQSSEVKKTCDASQTEGGPIEVRVKPDADIPEIQDGWIVAYPSPYEQFRSKSKLHRCLFWIIVSPAIVSVIVFLLMSQDIIPSDGWAGTTKSAVMSILIFAFAFSAVAFLIYAVVNKIRDIISMRRNPEDPSVIYNAGLKLLRHSKMKSMGLGKVNRDDLNKAIEIFEQSAASGFVPAQKILARFAAAGYVEIVKKA